MNQYGQVAKAFYETYRPTATAELGSEAEAHFAEIGEQVEQLIGETYEDLVDELPATTDTSERIGQINMALLRARESALQELIYDLPKEPGTEDLDMPRVSLTPITRG